MTKLKKYGIVILDRDGFTISIKKMFLEPGKASRIFEKFQKIGRGVIACLEGDPFQIEYTTWTLGENPGVHDVEVIETETLSREELFDLFPDLGSWTQRLIARSNECGGVGF